MRIICILMVIFCAGLAYAGTTAGAAPGATLEDLRYRISLGIWSDAGRAHLRLARLGPEHFRAEFTGGAQGFWKILNRWLPESYETEMSWVGDRLQPRIYIEEFRDKGHQVHKEFRFDYSRHVLEIWRGLDHHKPVKEYQFPLQEAVYDPLSLFYNLRLGVFGPLAPGRTLRVPLVPSPETREMVFRLGKNTPRGLEVMLEMKVQGVKYAAGPYFILSDAQGVPLQAWTRVLFFGKVSGELLNHGQVMLEGLPALHSLLFKLPEPGQTNLMNMSQLCN